MQPDLNQDSVYEPGETVRVFELNIINVGGMPTPKHRALGEHRTLARKHISKALQRKNQEYKNAKSTLVGNSRKRWNYVLNLLRHPILGDSITTDAEVFNQPATRIYTQAQYNVVKQADVNDKKRRQALAAANQGARKALLLP